MIEQVLSDPRTLIAVVGQIICVALVINGNRQQIKFLTSRMDKSDLIQKELSKDIVKLKVKTGVE